MGEELLVDVKEAARRLGIGRSLAYRLLQRGELCSVKVAGARRVSVADLEAFVERLRRERDEQ